VTGWRRFPAARAFTGFTGLCPAGYSSGDKTSRGHITKAGPETVRTALTEAAWYVHLVTHGKTPAEAVTAIARELAGLTWAEMTS